MNIIGDEGDVKQKQASIVYVVLVDYLAFDNQPGRNKNISH